jgi:predicted  nucleic acid-binding Zn-ribbon protein
VTIHPQIDALEALARIDAELKDLNDALTQEREALRGKQSHLAGLDERLERSKKSTEEMERTRNDLMGELRQMSMQIERSREKLSRCRTEREANAAQRELEELRKLYRDREQDIERLEALIGQAREESLNVNSERGSLASELGESQTDVMGRLAETEKSLAEKTAEREGLVKRVDGALFRRYEMIRKRKGTAIAYTSNGTCSACHMQLQPMLFQKLLRGDEFGQCPSCNRILYFRAAQAAEPETPSEPA